MVVENIDDVDTRKAFLGERLASGYHHRIIVNNNLTAKLFQTGRDTLQSVAFLVAQVADTVQTGRDAQSGTSHGNSRDEVRIVDEIPFKRCRHILLTLQFNRLFSLIDSQSKLGIDVAQRLVALQTFAGKTRQADRYIRQQRDRLEEIGR